MIRTLLLLILHLLACVSLAQAADKPAASDKPVSSAYPTAHDPHYGEKGVWSDFRDVSAQSGLDKPDCGAGATGWVMPGDWSGDHRCSLFFATQGGRLLQRGQDGVFTLAFPPPGYDFKADGQESGLTGAGCFAPVWRQDRQDLRRRRQ